jgi:Transposase DDE domain
MSKPNTPTYKTKNWPTYNEALKRRGALTIWFDPEMTWEAEPTGKRGRQPVYSHPAIQTCLTMKVLFGLALRQTTGFVESLLRLIGLKWTVPDFSTLSRRQKTLAVNIPHRGAQGPLHLLIDSTGIKVEGEGESNARKHGGPKRRVWRKVHLGIDEQTLEIRAVEVTSSDIGDAPMLPELLAQIPADQDIASVTADEAYDTRKCHDAIAERGAAAVIPPRKNAKPWKTATAGAVARNEALRASKYLGRALWRR